MVAPRIHKNQNNPDDTTSNQFYGAYIQICPNFMQISDILKSSIQSWIWCIKCIGEAISFTEKPEEIMSFLMILDENPNFFPKFVKNLHIQNFN